MSANHLPLRYAVAFWRAGLLVALLMPLLVSAVAAQAPRDYAISLPRVRYDAEGDNAIVSFSVANKGGDAVEATRINIVHNQTGRIETSVELPALATGAVYPFDLQLPLERFADGDIFLRVEAGIDAYEVAGSSLARDNSQLFRIDVSEAPSPFDFVIPALDIGVRVNELGIRLNNSRISWLQLALVVAMMLAILIVLWCLRLIARLLFRRPPAFEAWQPPYAFNAWHDPESLSGQRQNWQLHATSSIIQAPCLPDQAAVVKRLVDINGAALGAWLIKAARSEQYDAYGRVSRSQALMSRDLIQRLNKLMREAPAMSVEDLEKALPPIARSISKTALGAIEKQNRSLRIALDLRFEGDPGAARIIFELYQCRVGVWHLLDQWEPELGEIGSRVPEHFSLSLNGMLPGENYKEFKRRLPDEIAGLLLAILQPQSPAKRAAVKAETSPGSAP